MPPKITIVTPSFNQGQFIEETIRSVLDQNYPNLEYLIIDGGSTDQTIEVIRKYERQLSYWVSEKDRGQVHAINKGLARATGEIFGFLNSDDLYVPGTFEVVGEYFEKHPELLPPEHQRIAKSDGTKRAVADYVAGMTDRYALDTFASIFIPTVWSHL